MANTGIKTLAKETAIYGVSSIVGKFLNWCLVPLYSYTVSEGDYGIVTFLYSVLAVAVIVLTYGMETGYFRFASHKTTEESNKVYTTTMTSIAATALLFVGIIALFKNEVSTMLDLPDYSNLVFLLAIIVAIDAFSSIPFSYLRFKQRPYMFMTIKLLMIACNIFFNIFFLLICPKINQHNPELIAWFYNPNFKVGYIIIANFLSSVVGLIALLPFIFAAKWRFSFSLLKTMLKYSLPLLLLGIVGIMNQNVDKLLFPYICKYAGIAKEVYQAELGVYGACFKIAMVMMMFTYAFRFAYEPFVFAKKNSKEDRAVFATAMNYFVISTLFIYLALIAGLDILSMLLKKNFSVAIGIVPFVLITYFFQGVYYNLSLWYKKTDKTIWGTWFSLIGFTISLIINILFIPKFSYWACVFASLISFAVMMILCYALGQKYYPIKYDLKKIGIYTVFAMALSAPMLLVKMPNLALTLVWRIALVVPFVVYAIKKDIPIKEILHRKTKKDER
ncbi:MAG: oligosaccharide flippase family protein [Prevotellaceae bacterium]|jgi:O-antigen/teichoic acid export membrane protein|nr:oligosaccharide flippase family protein [Prevotellaceae bacterium]